MFLEKDTTWHDYIELLEFGMQFQQTSKFEAVAKSCLSKDSGCTSCSRLRAAGKHWYCPQHQVSQLTSSGNGLKTENLKIFDGQNLSKLFRQLIAAVWTRCTCAQFAQSCHVRCPPWGWQPPIWWTSFHLWPAVPRHRNCVNEHLFLGGLQHGVFFHGLNYAEEWPELRIQISTTFAQTWHTGRPVPCLDDCSLSKVHDVWHWSTIFLAFLFLAFFPRAPAKGSS